MATDTSTREPMADVTVAVENTQTWARRMTITVPSSLIETERKSVARRIAQQVRLPGFRKGKVPTDVLEKKFGPAIQQETIEKIVSDAYKEAIRREGLQPITQGAIEELDYQPGSDLTFHVRFEVRPDVELNRLGGFNLARPDSNVTDEQVERVLDRLRQEHATWTPVTDRAAVNGETATVEITPLDGDAPQTRRYKIVLGEGQTAPGVEEAIRSLLPGEEGDFTIDAHTDAETGVEHDHRAHIKVQHVSTPQLPVLDDEFAKSLGDFDSVATLRERVAVDLAREMESESERTLRSSLVDQIIDANPVEVPSSMVDQYLERVIRPKQGISDERVAQAREGARPSAEHAIKRMLVLEKVAELESLHATTAEVDDRLEYLASRTGRSAGEVRKQLLKNGQLDALAEEITEEKVFAYLKSLSGVE
jgi:trigger factor